MTKMWATIDTETSVKCPVGKKPSAKVGTPSPFWHENKIVFAASKVNGEDRVRIKTQEEIGKVQDNSKCLFVGQNIKFDLHHFRKAGTLATYDGVMIWDTQTAEYLLSNQQHHFASLDQLAAKYGGTQKDDKIKEYWQAGIDTEHIPEEELKKYLAEDVKNTDLVAAQQMQAVVDRGIGPLVWTQMDALRAVADIEYNGFCISKDKLMKYGQDLTDKSVSVIANLIDLVPAIVRSHVNLDSSADLAKIIFGGVIEWVDESDGFYKNGKPKKIKITNSQHIPGFVDDSTKAIFKKDWQTPKGAWSTSEEVLESVAMQGSLMGTSAPAFCGKLLEYRFLQKEISTYVEGLDKLIYPDGMLHGQIHTCSTYTGRYSSSQPNLQNMPSSEQSQIRDCFVSRFGKEGKIVTADFKQLEVVALAFLSRDKTLMEDIRKGRDIHFETGLIAGMWKNGREMTPEKRRVVKTINFGLIYGGGALTLSKQAKCSIETAKNCIEAFYDRYPGVWRWHQNLMEEIEKNAVSLGRVTQNGIPVKTSYLKLPTGRVFEIDQQITPWDKSGMNVSWPINKIKNYKVQGLATGDIVPLLLSKVWQEFQKDAILRERALFVNVVHDEIVLDVDCSEESKYPNIEYVVTKCLKEILEDGPRIFEETFGVEFDLPLRVDIKSSDSWGGCKK